MIPQHAGLSLERWSKFDFDQQILMIANELHRATKLTAPKDNVRRLASLERALALADLTVAAQTAPGRRRELLRWRDLLAEEYLEPSADAARLRVKLRAVLLLSPASAEQIPFVAS